MSTSTVTSVALDDLHGAANRVRATAPCRYAGFVLRETGGLNPARVTFWNGDPAGGGVKIDQVVIRAGETVDHRVPRGIPVGDRSAVPGLYRVITAYETDRAPEPAVVEGVVYVDRVASDPMGRDAA